MCIDLITVLALVFYVVVKRRYMCQHGFPLYSRALIVLTDVNVCEHPKTEQGMRGESSDLGREDVLEDSEVLWAVFM